MVKGWFFAQVIFGEDAGLVMCLVIRPFCTNFGLSASSHKNHRSTMWCRVVLQAMLWATQLGLTRGRSVRERGRSGTPKTDLIFVLVWLHHSAMFYRFTTLHTIANSDE